MTGVLEWLLPRLPGWLANWIRRRLDRPRPDVRILTLERRGGAEGFVEFAAEVSNYGTQVCRARFAAVVDGASAECRPTVVDLLVNAPPSQVRVLVPRPALGELVHELGEYTTLFGAALTLTATVDGQKGTAVSEWSEPMPDPETDGARYEALQRAWRLARGDDTPDDRRTELLRRMDQREDIPR